GETSGLIHMDMVAYGDKEDVPRFVGPFAEGAGGWEEGGLTAKVRRRPHSVVLLDGIEKAHPDVDAVLIRVLREGILTGGFGRIVDFRNTVLVLKASFDLSSDYGSGTTDPRNSAKDFTTETGRRFRPELVDHLDGIVGFHSLTEEGFKAVLDVELSRLRSRLEGRGVELTVLDDAISFLASKAGSPAGGARPLRRAVLQFLGNPLSEA